MARPAPKPEPARKPAPKPADDINARLERDFRAVFGTDLPY